MHTLVGRLLIAGIFLVITAPAQQIAWQPDFDEALKRAAAELKPVMIVFLMDDEIANDEVTRVHLHDPRVVALSQSFMCLVTSTGDHRPPGTNSDWATTRPACPRFGCVSCLDHQKVEMRARTEYMSSPRVAAPQFLFLAVDGKTVLLQHVFLLPVEELRRKMELVLGLLDPTKAGDLLAQLRATSDALLRDANGKNLDKRRDAMKALATSDDPRVIDYLIKQTADTVEIPRRIEAIEAMSHRGNGRVLPVLHKLLGSLSAPVRLAVAKSLESLGMAESGPTILAAIKRETGPGVRVRLVKALVACDPLTPDHRRFVIGLMKSHSQTDQMTALRASVRLWLDDELKKTLLTAASDANLAVRGVAYWALAAHGVAEAAPIISKNAKAEQYPMVKLLASYAVARLNGESYDESGADSNVQRLCWAAGVNY